jgi:membrane associated rhomboid family serine protease
MHQTVLFLIIANVLFSYKGLKDASFFEKYKFQIGPILNGEKIRLVTSGFLHADYMHLGFNMYALYLFSTNVIGGVGVSNFVLLYFGSLLFGNLFTMTYHKREPYYSAVGASGAVSGVVYSAVLLFPDMTLILFPIPIPLPGYVFGIGYLLYLWNEKANRKRWTYSSFGRSHCRPCLNITRKTSNFHRAYLGRLRHGNSYSPFTIFR